MTEYICQECNYQAKYKSRWDRHILTKPHLKNISEKGYEPRTSSNHTPILLPSYTKPYKCEYCKETFTERRNLTRHLKWCSVKKDIIKKLESDNEHLKEINVINVNEKNKEIEHLREIYNKEIEHLREISMTHEDVRNKEIEHLKENKKTAQKMSIFCYKLVQFVTEYSHFLCGFEMVISVIIKEKALAFFLVITEYNHFGAEITLKQQIEINYLKDLLDASGAMVKK